jgi:hypothetical protein
MVKTGHKHEETIVMLPALLVPQLVGHEVVEDLAEYLKTRSLMT